MTDRHRTLRWRRASARPPWVVTALAMFDLASAEGHEVVEVTI
ncbi:hypothetical protein [Sorangium sp. So ce394]